MSKHYPLLRNYVVEVAKDLIAQGVIQRRRGERIEQVVQNSAQQVATVVAADLRALAMELGVSFVTSGTAAIENFAKQKIDEALGNVMGSAKGSLFEFLANAANANKTKG